MKKSLILATCVALALVLGLAGVGMTTKPADPPCGTFGPLTVTNYAPKSCSYQQNVGGSTTGSFTVNSPSIDKNNCDTSLSPFYGNTKDRPDHIGVSIYLGNVSNRSDGTLVDLDVLNEFKNAFSFSPNLFDLINPGTGSQLVAMTFTNDAAIPVGSYDVTIHIDPENGLGVGAADITFEVEVTKPPVVKLDTLPPTVTIASPTDGAKFLLNGSMHVEFTAVDPPENGVGTGVWAMRAAIGSGCSETFQDITGNLSFSPNLPFVPADNPATATADITAAWIGSFALKAEADDNATNADGTPNIHTGPASTSFTVGVDVVALPPIAVSGRQFKAGETVPIKWKIAGYGGAFLPPFADIKAVIIGPLQNVERVAGDGAAAIRWELDANGNATQYITNYQIPTTALAGYYTIEIYVKDVCGIPVKQGEFKFFGAAKK